MRYFGFAKEDTFGTAKTTPTMFLDVGTCNLDAPSDPYMEIPTIEETPRRAKKGFYSPSGDIEYAMDLNSIGHFLYFNMGGYEFTEGSDDDDPNTHEIWVNSGRVLPSFTSFVGKDNGNANDFEHIFAGCILNKLSLEISDGLATVKGSIVAQKDSKGTLRTDSQVTIAEAYPLAFYEVTTKNNNVDVSAPTKSFTLEIDNGVKAEDGQGMGSMHPYRLVANSKALTISSDIEFQGDTYLKRFWGGNDGPTCYVEEFDYELNFEDELGNTMKVYFPKLYFKTATQPVEGSDLIQQSLEMGVLKDSVTLADDETIVQTSCLVTITNNESAIAL